MVGDSETINGTTATNVIKIHPADFYTLDLGYWSLVNPEVLKNSGDVLTLSYKIRR